MIASFIYLRIPLFLNSFIQNIFVERTVLARHCARGWAPLVNKVKVTVLMELHFCRERQVKQLNRPDQMTQQVGAVEVPEKDSGIASNVCGLRDRLSGKLCVTWTFRDSQEKIQVKNFTGMGTASTNHLTVKAREWASVSSPLPKVTHLRKCWSPGLNPDNLLQRFVFSKTVIWKLEKQNQGS